MVYVLASELLCVESLPFANYLQKTVLYSRMPWKRRLDKAKKYLESAEASTEKEGKLNMLLQATKDALIAGRNKQALIVLREVVKFASVDAQLMKESVKQLMQAGR